LSFTYQSKKKTEFLVFNLIYRCFNSHKIKFHLTNSRFFCLKNYFWGAKLNNHKTKMAKDFFIIFMCKNLLTKIYILKKTWALYLVGGQNYCCLKASTFSKIILYLRHPFYFFLALFLARRNKKSSIFLCQFYWKCMKIIRKVEKTSLLGPFNAKKKLPNSTFMHQTFNYS
jgi:hypothetical protein